MTDTLYLATRDGLATCWREQGRWREVDRGLKDQHVTSVIAREGVILAGTTNGVYRSDDGGQQWRAVNAGLTSPHVRWLAYHPDISDLELAGTEPAGIFVSNDGAEHWQSRPEVAALRDQHGWMLPYSPEAGCVRGFAFHGQRLYAAVEVGGILRSDDGGETWALPAGSDGNPDFSGPPEPFVYPDVHLYRSHDGGATWTLLYDRYCRALWLDPDTPEHIVFGPAERIGAQGRIEVTHDGGQTWQLASGSLDVSWSDTMPERFSQIDDELFTVLANGRLLAAPIATLEWKFIVDEVSGVNAVTTMR